LVTFGFTVKLALPAEDVELLRAYLSA